MMKKLIGITILLLVFFVLFSSCLAPLLEAEKKAWKPYIGCPESELVSHWGSGGDTNYYKSRYGSIKTTWYTLTIFGGALPGLSRSHLEGSPFEPRAVCITIQKGEISSISYHH